MKRILAFFAGLLLVIYAFALCVSAAFNLGPVLLFCMGCALILYALFYKRISYFCKKGFGLWVKRLFIVNCALFFAVTAWIAAYGAAAPAQKNEQVLLVLGAGLHKNEIGAILQLRLDTALAYYKKHPSVVIVVSGGQGPGEWMTEAEAMQNYLLRHGVSQNQIICEPASASTEENLLFSKALLQARGIKMSSSVAVVTNRFHAYRTMQFAQKAGYTNACMLPASTPAFVAPSCYLRETAAVLWLWARPLINIF